MKVDFGIVCHKDITNLEHVLNSCRACGLDYSIYVVDNSEDDEISAKIKDLIRVIPGNETYRKFSENVFYTKAINHILANTSGDFIFFICPAHTIIKDITWLDDAIGMFQQNDKLGLLGKIHSFPGIYHFRAEHLLAPQIGPERKVPNTFKFLDRVPREIMFDQPIQTFVHGGVFGIRREVLVRTGPFDEGFVHAFADAEFSLRVLLAGYGYGNVASIYSNSDNFLPPGEFKITHIKPTPEELAKEEIAKVEETASGALNE